MFRVLTSPRMVALHLLALVATTAAVWLGLWQYDAWQTRRDAQVQDIANAEPKPLSEVMSADDPYPGDAISQPVQFEGTWVDGETFLVSGREQDGKRGYWVVTPVAVSTSAADAAGGPALLVVRGWTLSPREAAPVPTGPVAVTGWLQPPEGSGNQDPDPGDDVLPELRIADAIQRVDQDLYGAYAIAEEVSTSSTTGDGGSTTGDDATAGLVPVTPDSLPKPSTFTALRNLLYALEWWVFGGFAVFIWWRWCRDEIARVSTGSTTGDPGATTEPGSSTSGADARPPEVASSP